MQPAKTIRLHSLIAAVCPITGISPPNTWPGTVRIDFSPSATQPQRDAAAAVIAAFDPSDAAQAAWEEAQKPERQTMRQAAAAAVTDIDTYLAISNPTNAQVAAQVRRLSQIMRAVIRRLIQID